MASRHLTNYKNIKPEKDKKLEAKMLDLIAMCTMLVLFIIGLFASLLIYCCCVVSSQCTSEEEKNKCESEYWKKYQLRKDIRYGKNK